MFSLDSILWFVSFVIDVIDDVDRLMVDMDVTNGMHGQNGTDGMYRMDDMMIFYKYKYSKELRNIWLLPSEFLLLLLSMFTSLVCFVHTVMSLSP